MTHADTHGLHPHLFCFGLGFSALALARRLRGQGWRVSGTCRSEAKRQQLARAGIEAHLFDRGRPIEDILSVLAETTDVLTSVPPDAGGDPVLDQFGSKLSHLGTLRWIGYLSTTGVYGDTGGARVDETSPVKPDVERSRRRAAAEAGWLELYQRHGRPVHIFRLAGIYGPGRSTLDQVRRGEARRIDRPGQVFSRIHVDDIATVLHASMALPRAGAIYNVCDDVPASPADVVAYACELLGVEPPPLIPFDEAKQTMSEMALSFWRDNRIVDNSRISTELGVHLAYPDYHSGLAAVLAAEQEAGAD